ncbi:cytochrome c family protein [Hyphomonas sp. GM-8P]|uniref:c-type cytochrome n=1 Tax=Hyphomonas sp. GM-8P TaxID=1280945 RepID=UPI001F19D571|nr:cytochrome c family protein [Hyphomonas sp. GM-8P]
MTRQIRRKILMGELGLNKILGALLATALGLFGLKTLSDVVFAHGGEGHGEEHAEATSLSEQMCEKFAYCVEVAGGGAAAAEEEEVFDLGALLAAADISRGERTFKGQCTTCHTIEEGGANGTGPNLHGVVGAAKHHLADFNYSAAMTDLGGTWTYEDLNHWLENPSSFARGTSMSFAGLRKDPDRINVIAYLAANTPDAPPFPAPLPAAGEDDGAAAAEEGAEAPAEGEEAAAPVEDAVEGAAETVTEAVVEEADAATETAEEAFDEDAPTPTEEEGE